MTAKDDSMELVELLAEAMRHPLSGDEIGQWPAYRNYARRALTAIEASGRRIVPVEITDLMAVSAVDDFDQMGVDVDRAMVRSAWSAALRVSPKVTT